MDITQFSSALAGVFVPWIVALFKRHVVPASGIAALILSYGVGYVCVALAYLALEGKPTLNGFLANFGVALALSQYLYHQFEDSFKQLAGE